MVIAIAPFYDAIGRVCQLFQCTSQGSASYTVQCRHSSEGSWGHQAGTGILRAGRQSQMVGIYLQESQHGKTQRYTGCRRQATHCVYLSEQLYRDYLHNEPRPVQSHPCLRLENVEKTDLRRVKAESAVKLIGDSTFFTGWMGSKNEWLGARAS